MNIEQEFLTHPHSQHIFSGPFEFAIRLGDKVVNAAIRVAMKFPMTIAGWLRKDVIFLKIFQVTWTPLTQLNDATHTFWNEQGG